MKAAIRVRRAMLCIGAFLGVLIAGCGQKAEFIPVAQQRAIDRSLVEYPAGYELKLAARFLSSPSAIAIDEKGTLFVAENGLEGDSAHIVAYQRDGRRVDIYPRPASKNPTPLRRREFVLRGPIGGMVAAGGRLYVTHRDGKDRGVVTAFSMDGEPSTVVAELPAEGDYSLTDIAMQPDGSRLYFGVGSVTNSGVVGRDNIRRGWVGRHEDVTDLPAVKLRLLGYRFDTRRSAATWLGSEQLAVTAPFHPFGKSTSVWVPAAPNDKPSAAIYSVSVSGGDLRVEAHGIRNPRGLAFNEYGRLYATNAGMEMRGTRPVRNDPDTVLRIVRGTWYGWPDFTADLQPVTQAQYQPPAELISRSGYPETSLLIDHQTSGLLRPDRQTLLQGVLPPQSGIGGMEFVPPMPQLQQYRGSAIITVWGEGGVRGQGAFAPGAPTARKVIRLDVDAQKAHDFIYNVHGDAATSQRWAETLQRPVDVKFAPDGALYILDSGAVDYRHGRLHKAIPYTGKIYRLDRTVTAK